MLKRSQKIDHLINTLNFKEVEAKLDSLIQARLQKKKPTITTLLDNVLPSLLKARESNVTFSELAEYLTKSGIPVSEATLRNHLDKHVQKPTRAKRKAKKANPKSKTPEEPASNKTEELQQGSNTQTPSSLPRRIARSNNTPPEAS